MEADTQDDILTMSIADPTSSSSRKPDVEFEPMFLDGWVKTQAPELEHVDKLNDCHHQQLKWKAMSALCCVWRDDLSNLAFEQLMCKLESTWIKKVFLHHLGPDDSSWPSDKELDPTEFGEALGLKTTSEDLQSHFIGLEETHLSDDQSMMNVVDAVPTGGTLALFASVTVLQWARVMMREDLRSPGKWCIVVAVMGAKTIHGKTTPLLIAKFEKSSGAMRRKVGASRVNIRMTGSDSQFFRKEMMRGGGRWIGRGRRGRTVKATKAAKVVNGEQKKCVKCELRWETGEQKEHTGHRHGPSQWVWAVTWRWCSFSENFT